MNRETFLATIRSYPDDDTHRLVFADWLADQGEQTAAARLRWWCAVTQKLRNGIEEDTSGDFRTLGRALEMADNWRRRLGCLLAIWGAEAKYTPPLNPSPWPENWSADRFLSLLEHSRSTVEYVALAILPRTDLQKARQLADEAGTGAGGMVAGVPQGINEALGPWVNACEVLHMAERSIALTKDFRAWDEKLGCEGGIAGELMGASCTVFGFLLRESLPEECR